MSVSELRLEIINRINAIEDELILEEIFKLVDIESHMDSVYRLTDEERKAVNIGFKDIEAGRTYSSEVADKMIKEWLRK